MRYWGDFMKKYENKKRKGFYIEQDLLDKLQVCLELDEDCKSINELVNKAIEFYTSFVLTKESEGYILKSFSNVVSAIVQDSENRMARIYFKLAVELAKLNNVIASNNSISEEEMNKLQLKCLDEVKRINGTISFEDAYKFQNDLK